MKLRLLLFSLCDRNCLGCCNKDWDLESLEICYNFSGYDEIMLTGGEPMLFTSLIEQAVEDIREQTDAPIYLYTAKSSPTFPLLNILKIINGLTLTLHEQEDFDNFVLFNNHLLNSGITGKRLRLNIFKNVKIPQGADLSGWIIKDNIEWIKNCPLPKNEVFKRY